MKKEAEDFLIDLREVIEETLTLSGDNSNCAALVISKISEKWGGGYVYVTKCAKWQIKERDYAVYLRFNGRNRINICREFGISESLFYNIIKRVYDERQTDLFSTIKDSK
jgi:Mor family transcriptional regulator